MIIAAQCEKPYLFTACLYSPALKGMGYEGVKRAKRITVIMVYPTAQYSLQEGYNPVMMNEELYLINIQD
jgi:hypothetical protein